MGPGAVGISEEAARAFVARRGFEKTAEEHPLLVHRPGCTKAAPSGIAEDDYVLGALARLVMDKLGEHRPMSMTVRTGREAYGRLPRPPECNERHFEAPDVKGAIQMLLERAGRQEKRAQAMSAVQHDIPTGQTGPFGPWSSLTDRLKNTLLGAGAGRALLFLAAGKNIPAGLERAVVLGGGLAGLSIGKKIKREQDVTAPHAAPEAPVQRGFATPAMSLEEVIRTLPPEKEDKSLKGDLRRDVISALAGGAAGATIPEVFGLLRARLASVAKAATRVV